MWLTPRTTVSRCSPSNADCTPVHAGRFRFERRGSLVKSFKGSKRIRYFCGQLLNAEDFTAEQEYFVEKLRRHNRHLHGWGISSGLEVSCDESTVTVSPGVAIDCAGNEIILDDPVDLDLPEKSKERHFVVVEYSETTCDPVPALDAEAGNALEDSRIEEEYRAYLSRADPGTDQTCGEPGTPGCGGPHPLCIACVEETLAGWTVCEPDSGSRLKEAASENKLCTKLPPHDGLPGMDDRSLTAPYQGKSDPESETQV